MFSAFFERPCLYFSMAIREGLALRRTIALFLFYFLSLSFFCSSSLFASFLPSAALSSAISVMNVLCVSEMEKLRETVNSRLLTMIEKMRLFCTFKNQSRSPRFIFHRNSVVSSFPERKNDLLKHERHHVQNGACHEIASGNMVTLVRKQNMIFLEMYFFYYYYKSCNYKLIWKGTFVTNMKMLNFFFINSFTYLTIFETPLIYLCAFCIKKHNIFLSHFDLETHFPFYAIHFFCIPKI